MNKKAQGTPVWIIIALVLGLVVLVVIALGFGAGWSELWQKMNVFTGGGSLATIGQACQIACSSNDVNSYCKQNRDIKGLSWDQVAPINGSSVITPTFPLQKPTTAEKYKAAEVTCNELDDANLISKCASDLTC